MLYALRYMAWLVVWKASGPDKPLSYYLHRYDRRQEIFRECKKGKE
jgi:hypothetical protein